MSEEKNGRYYKESSEKLVLKTGINRAIRSGTKVPYGTAGCKERRHLPLHRNVPETKDVVVCYNDIWYHVYVRRHYSVRIYRNFCLVSMQHITRSEIYPRKGFA